MLVHHVRRVEIKLGTLNLDDVYVENGTLSDVYDLRK